MRVLGEVGKFFGSRPRAWGPKATVGVATGPQRDAPKLSDSLLNNPLWVKDPFRTAPRKQPFRTSAKHTGRLEDDHAPGKRVDQ